MLQRTLARAVVIVMTGAMAVSGCGSSTKSASTSSTTSAAVSTSTPSPTTVLSAADLTAKANAICDRINKARKIKGNNSAQIVQLANSEYSELAKLGPPASLAAEWRRLVNDAGEDARTLARGVTLPASEQQKNVLPVLTKATEDFVAVAKRNGLRACAATKT